MGENSTCHLQKWLFLHDEGHQLGIFYEVALSLPKYLYADLKIEKVFLAKWKSVKISSRLLLHFVFRKLIFFKKASKFRKIVVVIFFSFNIRTT